MMPQLTDTDSAVTVPSSKAGWYSWASTLRSPLARKLIGYTVLFSSIITFSASGLQLYVGFSQDIDAIHAVFEDVKANRSLSIVESVWVLDEKLIQIQLEGIANIPDMEAANVLVNGVERWSAGELVSADSEEFSIPLIKLRMSGASQELGELKITADISAIRERVKDATILVLVSNAIKTFMVSIFFVIMFYFMIGRYLSMITVFARQYTSGTPVSPLSLGRSELKNVDELSYLVDSLNRMIFMIDDYRVKLSEKERVALKQVAELAIANEELEEFSYRTSHDLRAPIISTLSLLQFSKESLDDNQINDAVDGVDHAVGSLTNLKELIDNITQLTLIKKEGESDSDIDFRALLDESLSLLDHMEGFSRIDVRTECNHRGLVHTKKMRLKSILDNLLSNAIKYQDTSKELSYVQVRTSDEDGNFVLSVRDNGLGIPPEHQEELFKAFKRFHTQVSYGSGMGMYLMKTSAYKLGADLTYVNMGDGSMFKLIVPMGVHDGS